MLHYRKWIFIFQRETVDDAIQRRANDPLKHFGEIYRISKLQKLLFVQYHLKPTICMMMKQLRGKIEEFCSVCLGLVTLVKGPFMI